jgi:hypothetical protein
VAVNSKCYRANSEAGTIKNFELVSFTSKVFVREADWMKIAQRFSAGWNEVRPLKSVKRTAEAM